MTDESGGDTLSALSSPSLSILPPFSSPSLPSCPTITPLFPATVKETCGESIRDDNTSTTSAPLCSSLLPVSQTLPTTVSLPSPSLTSSSSSLSLSSSSSTSSVVASPTLPKKSILPRLKVIDQDTLLPPPASASVLQEDVICVVVKGVPFYLKVGLEHPNRPFFINNNSNRKEKKRKEKKIRKNYNLEVVNVDSDGNVNESTGPGKVKKEKQEGEERKKRKKKRSVKAKVERREEEEKEDDIVDFTDFTLGMKLLYAGEDGKAQHREEKEVDYIRKSPLEYVVTTTSTSSSSSSSHKKTRIFEVSIEAKIKVLSSQHEDSLFVLKI